MLPDIQGCRSEQILQYISSLQAQGCFRETQKGDSLVTEYICPVEKEHCAAVRVVSSVFNRKGKICLGTIAFITPCCTEAHIEIEVRELIFKGGRWVDDDR